jgi:hypothetical protein
MLTLGKQHLSVAQLIGGLEEATGEALLISREEYTALLLRWGEGSNWRSFADQLRDQHSGAPIKNACKI